jgi:hypothetical protein
MRANRAVTIEKYIIDIVLALELLSVELVAAWQGEPAARFELHTFGLDANDGAATPPSIVG